MEKGEKRKDTEGRGKSVHGRMCVRYLLARVTWLSRRAA